MKALKSGFLTVYKSFDFKKKFRQGMNKISDKIKNIIKFLKIMQTC